VTIHGDAPQRTAVIRRTDRHAPPPADSHRPQVKRVAGFVVLLLLGAASLTLTLSRGAYVPMDWLPVAVGIAALALVLVATGPNVGASRPQTVLVALFAAQAVWTGLSMLWASSPFNAWQELNRTLLFGLGLTLAFAAVRWCGPAGQRWLATLVAACVATVGVIIIVRLATTANPASLFASGRLNYPVTYWNALAALLMLGFWLTLGLANAGWEWREKPKQTEGRSHVRRRHAVVWRSLWVPPLFLALAVMLLELALLPQSRGALWALVLVVPFFVILSPHRFRALLHLVFVALPVIIFWNRLNGVYATFRDSASFENALHATLAAIGLSMLMVCALWVASWAVERWSGPLTAHTKRALSITLVVLVVAAAAAGLILADRHTEGLGSYAHTRWTEFTSDKGTSSTNGSGRFSEMSLNGRLIQWQIAARAFSENPLLGLGAQNYEPYYFQHRTSLLEVRQPHSQPMQLLAELGLPGAALWLILVVAALLRSAVLRFRSADRAAAVLAATITGVLSWFVHSSADWIWQLAGVSLPAMMLMGGLIASSGSPDGAAAHHTHHSRQRWQSTALRAAGALVCMVIMVSTALPYLALRYTDTAATVGEVHLEEALDFTRTAERLDPTSPLPAQTRAMLHRTAARSALPRSPMQSEHYSLAAANWQAATAKDPSSWLFYLQTAALHQEWSQTCSDKSTASEKELLDTAQYFLDKAKALNPLSPECTALQKVID
jgi:hypothetical protein